MAQLSLQQQDPFPFNVATTQPSRALIRVHQYLRGDLPLVQLYLHTMTNGVLVGGDNSKMSVLEKLARLALEN